jgi:hypothetical protein
MCFFKLQLFSQQTPNPRFISLGSGSRKPISYGRIAWFYVSGLGKSGIATSLSSENFSIFTNFSTAHRMDRMLRTLLLYLAENAVSLAVKLSMFEC